MQNTYQAQQATYHQGAKQTCHLATKHNLQYPTSARMLGLLSRRRLQIPRRRGQARNNGSSSSRRSRGGGAQCGRLGQGRWRRPDGPHRACTMPPIRRERIDSNSEPQQGMADHTHDLRSVPGLGIVIEGMLLRAGRSWRFRGFPSRLASRPICGRGWEKQQKNQILLLQGNQEHECDPGH